MNNITITKDEQSGTPIYTMGEGIRYGDVRDAIADYYKGPLTRYTIWDFSKIQRKPLTVEDVAKLGEQVRESGKARREGFDLIVISNFLHYGLVRIYLAYFTMKEKDSQALRPLVFRGPDEALAWMRRHMAMNSGE